MRSDAIALPRLGLGTAAALGVMGTAISDEAADAVVATAYARGIRFFDTAPLYGGGLAEERLGHVLRTLPRDDVVLSTKTGVTRPYRQAASPPGGLRRRSADVWDYSPEATKRSVALSLERLGVERLDLVHLHDVDGRVDQAMAAYPALDELRAAGVIAGIGIGANHVDAPLALLERGRFDAVLVPGRYTLLDQTALPALLPLALERGIRIVIGGVFNSGVLAGQSTFDYDLADRAILKKVEGLRAICRRHDVDLKAAALQFPLAHKAVTSLLLGPRSVAELEENLVALSTSIPAAFWDELRDRRLLDARAPTP
jgi:D-threo-aldose 1-dehydrogenase